MSIWDDPSLSTGDYVKFENVGDEIVGTILDVSVHTWPEDGSKSPKLVIDTTDGERVLTAGQVQLKVKLAEARPEAGDRIKIVHTSVEKRSGGKTLKHFDVTVQRGTAPVAAAAPADNGAPF